MRQWALLLACVVTWPLHTFPWESTGAGALLLFSLPVSGRQITEGRNRSGSMPLPHRLLLSSLLSFFPPVGLFLFSFSSCFCLSPPSVVIGMRGPEKQEVKAGNGERVLPTAFWLDCEALGLRLGLRLQYTGRRSVIAVPKSLAGWLPSSHSLSLKRGTRGF